MLYGIDNIHRTFRCWYTISQLGAMIINWCHRGECILWYTVWYLAAGSLYHVLPRVYIDSLWRSHMANLINRNGMLCDSTWPLPEPMLNNQCDPVDNFTWLAKISITTIWLKSHSQWVGHVFNFRSHANLHWEFNSLNPSTIFIRHWFHLQWFKQWPVALHVPNHLNLCWVISGHQRAIFNDVKIRLPSSL